MECFESYETFFILQVLSRTTASGLESQGRHDTSGTVKFLRMIDRVFDCLNVSHFNQNTKGKPECKEYRDVNDWRFEVLIYFMLIICNISSMLSYFCIILQITKAICPLKKSLSSCLVATL